MIIPYKDIEFSNELFYVSIYEYVNSNMYVMASENEAVIIDPHKSIEITDLLKENKVNSLYILLTHEHHDHTSGIYWFQENFNTTLICQKDGEEWMKTKQYLRPTLLKFIIGEEDKKNGTNRLNDFKENFVSRQYEADVTFDETMDLKWREHCIRLIHIPGHSKGSCLMVFDGKFAFTGDSLLKDIPIITRFPGSCHEDYIQKTIPTLKKELKENMMIFPGHGMPFCFKELFKGGRFNVQFR